MIVIFETTFYKDPKKMKISENQIRSLVREEILREHKKTLKEDKERRLQRRLRRAQRLAQRAGNEEVASELDDLLAMAGDPQEEEGGEQSARTSSSSSSQSSSQRSGSSTSQPAALSDEEISMAGDRYTYVYDKAASDATVASGRDGEVQLHFTVASGPANVGRTMALRDGHPLEAELRKQQRVLQDLERAEGGEEVTVADVEEDDDEQPDVQMESKKRSLKRSELRKMLQREAFRALTK